MRWLLTECLVQLIIFAIFFLGRTLGLRPDDMEGLVRKRLKFGTLEAPVVRRMMRYAFKLTEQTLESLGVSGKRVNEADFDFPEPQYSDEVIRVLRLIADRPGEGYALPSFVDYVLHELYLKRNGGLPILSSVMVGSDVRSVARLATSIGNELVTIGAIPLEVVATFRMAVAQALSKSEESSRDADLSGEPGARSYPEGTPEAISHEAGAARLNLFET